MENDAQIRSDVDVGAVDSYSKTVQFVSIVQTLSEERVTEVDSYSNTVQFRSVRQSRSDVAVGATD